MLTVNTRRVDRAIVERVTLSVEHTDLGTAVTASLRAAIVSGELPAGGRLVETELAKQFGVSRGPIRDALAELQRSGLVELRARKGSFVRSLTADDVDEVYSLRIALESLAVRQAAARDSRQQPNHERLRSLLAQLATANDVGDSFGIGEADMALHRAIVENAGHSRLLDAWERLADQTLLMMTNLGTLGPETQGPAGVHSNIIEHIIEGDTDAAVTTLAEHLDSSRQVVLEHFVK